MEDIAGGMQIDIDFPSDGTSPLLTHVVEGLLKGLGNIFKFEKLNIYLVNSLYYKTF